MKINKKESIKYGWEVMKENFALFSATVVLTGIASFVFQGILSPIGFVVQTFVSMGIIRIALNLIDHKKAKLEDLWADYKNFFKFFVTTVLIILIVVGGLILFVIPGIIWLTKYFFADYLVVDKGLSPKAALKKSGEMTLGHRWDLFLLLILLSLINIAGILAFGIGLFITIPVTTMAKVFVYRKLSRHQS